MSLTTADQHLNPRDPCSRPTRLACSSVDLLWVMSYTPGQGDQGTPISVNFSCKADLKVGTNIRLVVGRRAVSTKVHEIDSPGGGRWQLTGHAPSFSKQQSSSPTVPLTIQAIANENKVVDSVTFGDFVYHTTHPTSGETVVRSSKRRSPYTQPQSPPSSDSEHGSSQAARTNTQLITPALRRASRQMGSDPDDTNRTIILDITTPLDNFCFDWQESELHAGRRLVRFQRLQDGNRLIVSPERISQADYDANDIVISCIYREETDACCVTSVDIIHLLQRLVDAEFEIDEKNRIRRNLEGLRPTTVSKTRPGFESFFQRIMDFPDPKPRKIEKDVKVFDWKLLPHALDKILSKYSLCPSPTISSPRNEAPSPSFSTMVPHEMSTTPSASGAPSAYDNNSSRPQHEPHLDALYVSQPSLVHLAPFANECSPDSSPEVHRRPSLHEEQLQSLYLDTVMQRYFPESDITYGAPPPPPSSLQSPVYTTEFMAHDTSPFVGDRAQHEWATRPANDVMLVSPQEPIYSPAYGYSQSEPVDIYATPPLPIHAYDSFEFHTLREHNTSAMSASQHA